MSSVECDVIVIGGGVGGLAAAGELTRADLRVALLEARDRPGGRIFTMHDAEAGTPIELGAEFVHGKPAEIWDLLRSPEAGVREITGRDWCARGGTFGPCDAFENVEAVLNRMTRRQPDRSFLAFVEECCPGEEEQEAKLWALGYVRGFHAARVDEISVNSLVEDEEADESIEGHQSFRIAAGYDYLVHALLRSCYRDKFKFYLNTTVELVEWRPRAVSVRARSASGETLSVSGRSAVITLPLGVLQAGPGTAGAVEFVPVLEEKQAALSKLAMGKALRVTLHFRERFWERGEVAGLASLRFLFSEDTVFPTWWSAAPSDAPVLTGWAPAECAEALSGRAQDSMMQAAIESLARILRTPRARLQELVVRGYVHDWQSDPFARGAYSYIKVGGEDAPRQLATPLADTLFFAGEATHSQGHHGTVHGAIASGVRAAKEVLQRARESSRDQERFG